MARALEQRDTIPEPRSAARKARRRRGLLIFLLLLAVVLVATRFQVPWPAEIEHERIRMERMVRATIAGFGLTLPGTPDLSDLDGRLKAHGVALGAPVMIRIFKREFELELWMMRDGRFHRFATYPICRWSGRLGPKLAQGDRQAPEGFYTVDEKALNPQSRWHRSFNIGFPNVFDKAHGRTGTFLMVHGGCGSIGCYAMTNPVIDEIWRLVTAALRSGQPRFPVHIFPFRMTESNLALYAGNPNLPFWRTLKEGHDLFEANLLPPKASVCNGAYAFEPAASAADASTPVTVRCPAARPAA